MNKNKKEQRGGDILSEIILNTLNKVDTLKDLVKLCNSSKQVKNFCNEYPGLYFYDLMKKKDFNNSYSSKLKHYIETDDLEKFRMILKFYPLGKFYNRKFDILNNLQKFAYTIGPNIDNFLNRDNQIINLNDEWKVFLEFIFLPKEINIENFNNEISNLQVMELGFHREKYYKYFGDWDFAMFNDIIMILKIIKDNMYNILEDGEMNIINNLLRQNNLSDVSYNEIEDNILEFITEDILKNKNSASFFDFLKVFIKRVVYLTIMGDEDDIEDLLPHANFSLNLLFKLSEKDDGQLKLFILQTIIDCYTKDPWLSIRGLNLNNYNDYVSEPTYIYLERLFQYFNLNSNQRGGGNNQQKIGEYIILKELGRGSYGIVYLAYKNAKRYIIKQIQTEQLSKNELEILKKLRRNCQEDLLCYVEDFEKDEFTYIVTNVFEDSISLYDFIDKKMYINLTHTQLLRIMQKIAIAIHKLHALDILHLDIKPDNILINRNYNIQIIDYGFSCDIDECLVGGTFQYASPEMIFALFTGEKDLDEEVEYYKSDIFSLGLVFYVFMNNGEVPIQNIINDDTIDIREMNNILNFYENGVQSSSGDKDIDKLIEWMLEFDYTKRPSIDDVIEELEDIIYNEILEETTNI